MTMNNPNIHSPSDHLRSATQLYPNAWKQVEEFWRGRGTACPNWPQWCFLPMSGWYAIVAADNKSQRLPPHLVRDVAHLSAIGTWRYTQGVYRFDPELFHALIHTPLDEVLPIHVLYCLPEWCLYIDLTATPLPIEAPIAGFWVHLEYDSNTHRPELRVLLNGESFSPLILHLAEKTLSACIESALYTATIHAEGEGLPMPTHGVDEARKFSRETLQLLIPLILYLCSAEPEITNPATPTSKPQNPQLTKTKKGWRMFPPSGSSIWMVGQQIGEQLRHATSGAKGKGGSPAIHVRRAHWHGYWKGPRNKEQTFFYKWLPPTFVGTVPPTEEPPCQ